MFLNLDENDDKDLKLSIGIKLFEFDNEIDKFIKMKNEENW